MGINPETLRNWVSQVEIDKGHLVGHKKASMTMDVYASRQTVSEGMAAALVIGAGRALASA